MGLAAGMDKSASAVDAWEALGRPYRAAQALRRKAEALLAGGDREAAAEVAQAALASAQTIGAGWLASEVEGFAHGMTVATNALLERTNREIGAALYMAEKTASVHVSRILSKLDVRSRTEAAAVAHRVGLV